MRAAGARAATLALSQQATPPLRVLETGEMEPSPPASGAPAASGRPGTVRELDHHTAESG